MSIYAEHQQSAPHPYRVAWQNRDVEAWAAMLARDLIMHSPVLTKPFVGRDAAIDLFDVLFGALGEFRIVHELGPADTRVFFWEADYEGGTIEGADLIRLNGEGLVSEITVLIRPLVAIGRFASALGPGLARKRSNGHAVLVRILNAPLGLVFATVDKIASRLLLR